jgi:spore coat protein A, manganese oxidase
VRPSRREFIRNSILTGMGLLLPAVVPEREELEYGRDLNPSPIAADSLARFVDRLPIPEIARSDGYRPSPHNARVKVPYYRIEMREFQTKVHRDLKPTRMWGYDLSSPGPTFETRSGQGLIVEWVNRLPLEHLLPIDHNIHGAESDKPDVRTVVHLHGAKAPPASDGYPEKWFVPGQSALYYYPNNQDATMLWYHDHAMGITRLNVFAGLFGAFLIRDKLEDDLNLPKGQYEIPLIIYDRNLDRMGGLNYPISPTFRAPWVPEFSGNLILVNGKIFPYLEVEPRKYRFRIVNVANGRIFRLALSNGQSLHQIGSDQGLLKAPVQIAAVQLAPAERADIVVDFAGHDGENISLKNGDLEIMQFRVSRGNISDIPTLPSALRPIAKLSERAAVIKRLLTLDEYVDSNGRMTRMLLNGTHWHEPVTEKPTIGTTEIWSLINLTKDIHPIHLHMVRFQILDYRPFDVDAYRKTGLPAYTGPALAPDLNDAGWKDTVRVAPGTVARVIMQFEGFCGRYVWHCHILEHEDNEMMRPYDVIAAK